MADHRNEQTVIFSSGGRAFGLELDRVESIIEKDSVTRAPNAPSAVEGIVFYRDKVLPVINLPMLLNLTGGHDGNLIVVVRDEIEDFGLSSDRIHGIIPSSMLNLKHIPVDERENRYIAGTGKYNEIEFSLLDFSDKEI